MYITLFPIQSHHSLYTYLLYRAIYVLFPIQSHHSLYTCYTEPYYLVSYTEPSFPVYLLYRAIYVLFPIQSHHSPVYVIQRHNYVYLSCFLYRAIIPCILVIQSHMYNYYLVSYTEPSFPVYLCCLPSLELSVSSLHASVTSL